MSKIGELSWIKGNKRESNMARVVGSNGAMGTHDKVVVAGAESRACPVDFSRALEFETVLLPAPNAGGTPVGSFGTLGSKTEYHPASVDSPIHPVEAPQPSPKSHPAPVDSPTPHPVEAPQPSPEPHPGEQLLPDG